MAPYLLIRADDLVVLGLSWSGLRLSSATGSGGVPELVAADGNACLTVTFPPQHVAEETSVEDTGAPLKLQAGPSGATVPAWRGVVSGPSRVTFTIARNTRVPVTAEGFLAAMTSCPIVRSCGPPGLEKTAIELPWRLLIVPRTLSGSGSVVCVHPSKPDATGGVTGLWRTRMMSETASASSLDAELAIVAIDEATAAADDPPFTIPLAQAERVRVAQEASRQPARVSRLELTALGGTLDATADWGTFQWEHHAVLGRDMLVRTLAKGVLYPLGHRAEFLQLSERIIDPSAGNAAVLRQIRVLTIIEPVRRASGDEAIGRAFPFGDVTLTKLSFTDLAPPRWQRHTIPGAGTLFTHFWPTTPGGNKVLFPISCANSAGAVRLEIPLLFVAEHSSEFLSDQTLAKRLAQDYGQVKVTLPGSNIDLVQSATRARGDVHEVHKIIIAGADVSSLSERYRAKVTEFEIGLPALRSLLGDRARKRVAFAEAYLRNGIDEDVLLKLLSQQLDIGFTQFADRSGGLVAPRYIANAVSRTLGPVNLEALPDPSTKIINPLNLFRPDATLLGFPLRDLVKDLKAPPEITSVLSFGSAPEVLMHWPRVTLKSFGPFVADAGTTLDLNVVTRPGHSETECTISNFALELPPGPGRVLRLDFATMKFTQHNGQPPLLNIPTVKATFLGELRLIKKLGDALDFSKAGELVKVTPTGITVSYSLAVPSVPTGVFVLRNIAVSASVVVPFNGQPVTVSLGFASRTNPFQLSVLAFGGGGYLEMEIDRDGLKRLEAGLEFGALVAVDFLVASGEVHALGGASFVLERDRVMLTGYLRIGGSVEILGLISVSVELRMTLSYRSDRNALIGRATLVIEIDLTLWSTSVELDSGEWVLAGDTKRTTLPQRAASDGLERWRAYRAAFAPINT